MKGTSLPNCLIETIVELNIIARIGAPDAPKNKAVLDRVELHLPGDWMIEKSSLAEKRSLHGSSDSIVRLICFYKKFPHSDITYCVEDMTGNFLTWSNCRFLSLLTYDWGWAEEADITKRNLIWAQNACKKHKIEDELEGKEAIFWSFEEARKTGRDT